MLEPVEFLRAITPVDGYYAIVTIKNKSVNQQLISNLDDVPAITQAAVAAGRDAYFGCASFTTPDSRTKNNVQHVKSFWVDLDCGEGTAYSDQQEGFDAVKRFCRASGMPKPWVVNSGRGLHLYWPFATPILTPLWLIYATRLVQLCAANDLIIKDPSCSTDAARILRIPATTNFKDPEDTQPVSIVCTAGIPEWVSLKDIIEKSCGVVGINGFHEPAPVPVRRRPPMDAATKALLGHNQIYTFKLLAQRSLAGSGCGQIAHALTNISTASYNLWRGGLSIGNLCDDRDMAIHKMSRGHPDYSAEVTEEKASDTAGPYTCETFRTQCEKNICEECQHWGKIKSPIVLGRQIARAVDPIIVAGVATAANTPAPILGFVTALPTLPWPYFRGAGGGIYMEGTKNADGSPGKDVLIYEYNLDLVRRIKDPEFGETLVLHLMMPKDGLKEIVIPLRDAQSLDRMKDALGFSGVAAGKDQMSRIGTYMIAMVKNMQSMSAADPARTQMGWTEDKKGFVWGRMMFTDTVTEYCPPANKALSVANSMVAIGGYDDWERAANCYAAPGLELRAACLLMALGSVMHPFTYDDPIWLHMYSAGSGTGKTSILKLINSMWGNPEVMNLTVVDTNNSVEKRRVIYNSIAICQDEITNLPAEKVSEMAYAQSQGREKLRLSQGSTEINNSDRRYNHRITTGNKSVIEILSHFKTNADGEMARIIEVMVPALEDAEGHEAALHGIFTNYGHLGPTFIKWVIDNKEEAHDIVARIKAKFRQDFKSTSKERNWVSATVGMLAVGYILQEKLGLFKAFNMSRIADVWLAHMQETRSIAAEQLISHEHLLGDFINENISNIVIPDQNSATANAAAPSIYGRKVEREARNKLLLRWEKDTNLLFVSHSELKNYCVRRGHSFTDMLLYYSTSDHFKGIAPKRMASGTGVVSGSIKAICFSTGGGHIGGLLTDNL